jgi:hypothetical protein
MEVQETLDPHYGLKDNLATCDRLKIMCHICGGRRTNWAATRGIYFHLGEPTKLLYVGIQIENLCMPTFQCQVVMVPKRRVAFHKPYCLFFVNDQSTKIGTTRMTRLLYGSTENTSVEVFCVEVFLALPHIL